MSFGTHVFISYAQLDNDKATGAWVNQFHEKLAGHLKSSLIRTPPVIWRDNRLSDNDVFSPVIFRQLADSAVMVAVVTDNYVASPWCQKEAHTFCEDAERTIGVAPQDKSRVFKIFKRPPQSEQTLPPPMRKLTGTRFFVRINRDDQESDDDSDKAVELDPGFGDRYGKMLNLKVALLAEDIARTLKAVGAVPASISPVAVPAAAAVGAAGPTAAPPRPTVYLAQCGDDRQDDREQLRSELLQFGYTVVPERELPMAEAAYRAEVARLLARSSLSIHLLGAKTGTVLDADGGDSVMAIQNALAVERARAAQLCRVVSLPAGTKAGNARHQAFLDDMHAKADVHGEAELIVADLDAVKKAVHAALQAIEAPPPAVQAPTGDDTAIYVILAEPDLQASRALRDALEAADFSVLRPLFDGGPEAVREANMKRLLECDAVLVYYGSGSDGWKAAVDGELKRTRKQREGRPVFTWLAGASTADKADLLGRDRVIDGRAGFAPALVEPILQVLRTRPTQAPQSARPGVGDD